MREVIRTTIRERIKRFVPRKTIIEKPRPLPKEWSKKDHEVYRAYLSYYGAHEDDQIV